MKDSQCPPRTPGVSPPGERAFFEEIEIPVTPGHVDEPGERFGRERFDERAAGEQPARKMHRVGVIFPTDETVTKRDEPAVAFLAKELQPRRCTTLCMDAQHFSNLGNQR